MAEISPAALAHLENAAWDWNPIDVPRTKFTVGEYDCIVEAVVPLLQQRLGVREIVAYFDRFFPVHWSLSNPPGCAEFAAAAIEWWDDIHREPESTP